MFHHHTNQQALQGSNHALNCDRQPPDPIQRWLKSSAAGAELSRLVLERYSNITPKTEIERARIELEQAKAFIPAVSLIERGLNLLGRSSARQVELHKLIRSQEMFVTHASQRNQQIREQLVTTVDQFIAENLHQTPDLKRVCAAVGALTTLMRNRHNAWKQVESQAYSIRRYYQSPSQVSGEIEVEQPSWRDAIGLGAVTAGRSETERWHTSFSSPRFLNSSAGLSREATEILLREQRECYDRGRVEQDRFYALERATLPNLKKVLEEQLVLGFQSSDGTIVAAVTDDLHALRKEVARVCMAELTVDAHALPALVGGVEVIAVAFEQQMAAARKMIAARVFDLLSIATF